MKRKKRRSNVELYRIVKEGARKIRERNSYGNIVETSDCLRAERATIPMVLISMDVVSPKRRRASDTETPQGKMNWAEIPSTDELETRGVHDRMEALVQDMDKWSLFGLRKWRKPLNVAHVKRQQRKLKLMFLQSSSSSAETSSKASGSHRKTKTPQQSPIKNMTYTDI